MGNRLFPVKQNPPPLGVGSTSKEDIRGWEAAGEIIPQQKHNRLRINSKLKHYWKKIKLYF